MIPVTKKKILSNGLTVILETNPFSEIVSLNLGVKVGSVYEAGHESGLCHLIEHMVFKGTKSFAPGEIATLVEAGGGELNAYTSLDQTVYYINTPKSGFALGMKILKEMVFDAVIDAEELEREKEVVVEEIRRGKDDPMRVLGEVLFSFFYKRHPYRRPVIGTEKLVRGFTRKKVLDFYKNHYQPRNMVLGICGHVSEKECKALIEKYFDISRSRSKKIISIPKESQRKNRRVILESMEITATYFDIGFSVPDLAHDDIPALDVLSHLLGESGTSLLEKHTHEEEQLVHSIYSSCYTPKYPGMFAIGGQVDPQKINAVFISIRRQIDTAREILFDPDDVGRAKTLMKAQLIFDKETCEGTARKWMIYETVIDDYAYDQKYIEKIETLTPEDIRSVARKYLQPWRALVAVLHPPRIKIKINKTFFQKQFRKEKKVFFPLRQKRGMQLYELDNGIRVLIKENPRLPIGALKLVALGGLRYETARTNGLSHLMSHCLTKGTRNSSYLQLAQKCEELAASVSSYAGRNSWGGSLGFLTAQLKPSLHLFADVILNPLFAEEEVKKERDFQLESIQNRSDNPSQLCFLSAMQRIFKPHPYQYDLLGETKQVRSFCSEDLQTFYRSLCFPENLVVSIVGDVEAAEVLDILNGEFAHLQDKKNPAKKLKAPAKLKTRQLVFQEKEKNQAHLVVGFLSSSFYDRDRYVLDVINSLLSGQGGRLFLELRDKKSLAYTVTSTLIEGLETGFFGVYIGSEPNKIRLALDGIFGELDKLKTKRVGDAELARAKNYIIGNHSIDHQKNSSIALQLALNELYGLKMAEFFDFQKYIRAVTSEDIMRVAQRVLRFDQGVVSLVGPKGCRRLVKSFS